MSETIVSKKFGPLSLRGCAMHLDRTDLPCFKIRDASGRVLLHSEIWEVLKELSGSTPIDDSLRWCSHCAEWTTHATGNCPSQTERAK